MKLPNVLFVAALAAAGPVLGAAPAEAVPICAAAHVQVLVVDQSTGLICLPYPFAVHCEATGGNVGTLVDVDLYVCVPLP